MITQRAIITSGLALVLQIWNSTGLGVRKKRAEARAFCTKLYNDKKLLDLSLFLTVIYSYPPFATHPSPLSPLIIIPSFQSSRSICLSVSVGLPFYLPPLSSKELSLFGNVSTALSDVITFARCNFIFLTKDSHYRIMLKFLGWNVS